MPSYAENTDALDQYLQNSEDDDLDEVLEIDLGIAPKRNAKRKREIFEEIVVQRGPPGVAV